MAGIDAGPVLGTQCRFIADKVGVSPCEACRSHRFMGIDHYMMLGRFLYCEKIMVDDGLAVVMLPVRDDIADITALDRIVAVLVHKVVGRFHMTLVIDRRRRRLMMHHKTYALGVRISVECGKIEIGIRSDEVKHVVLLVTVPILPSFVPPFDEKGVESVLRREIYITPHVFVVGTVLSVGSGLGIVRHTQLDGRIIIGIGPLALVGYHLPPYAHVFDRMYP